MESDWVKVRLYVYWKSYSKRFVSRRVDSSYSHEVFQVLNLLTQHNFIWLLIISILQAIKEPLIHYTITDVKVLPAACKAFPVNSSSRLAALHSAAAAVPPMSVMLTARCSYVLPAAGYFTKMPKETRLSLFSTAGTSSFSLSSQISWRVRSTGLLSSVVG